MGMSDTPDTSDTPDGPGGVVPRLDRLDRDLLRVLGDAEDGEATTTELKAATGADNHRILYRVKEHLGPPGLVEFDQPTTEGGRVPPKVIRLTGAGADVAASLSPGGLDGDAEGDTAGDRRPLEARFDRLEAEVEWLADQTEDLAEREFDLIRAGMLGLRDYLVEETDADPETIAAYVDRHERSGGSAGREAER